MKGSGIPVMGISPKFIPMFTANWISQAHRTIKQNSFCLLSGTKNANPTPPKTKEHMSANKLTAPKNPVRRKSLQI